jgi:hypothetical protein
MNRAWQAAGNKPYSLRVGDKWYGYNRVEPIGMHMAALADTVETLKFAHDEDAEQLAWSAPSASAMPCCPRPTCRA